MDGIIFMLLLWVVILMVVVCNEEIEQEKMKAASDALTSALRELCEANCNHYWKCDKCSRPRCKTRTARKVLEKYKKESEVVK